VWDSDDDDEEDEDETDDREQEKPGIIKYEALSWRWGNEEKGHYAIMIKKDGMLRKKRVSHTLGLALKYLRRPKERILWIDAICINQVSNSPELSPFRSIS
jgi:hypothetical protein